MVLRKYCFKIKIKIEIMIVFFFFFLWFILHCPSYNGIATTQLFLLLHVYMVIPPSPQIIYTEISFVCISWMRPIGQRRGLEDRACVNKRQPFNVPRYMMNGLIHQRQSPTILQQINFTFNVLLVWCMLFILILDPYFGEYLHSLSFPLLIIKYDD